MGREGLGAGAGRGLRALGGGRVLKEKGEEEIESRVQYPRKLGEIDSLSDCEQSFENDREYRTCNNFGTG